MDTSLWFANQPKLQAAFEQLKADKAAKAKISQKRLEGYAALTSKLLPVVYGAFGVLAVVALLSARPVKKGT